MFFHYLKFLDLQRKDKKWIGYTHLFVELWILVEELEGLTDAVIHLPQAGQRRLSLSRSLQDILDDNQFMCRMSLIEWMRSSRASE
jgi:hypothetical protein